MVEAAHLIRLAVVQLQPFYLSIFSCQITDRLLASMKVDPDIYCHRRLLLLTQIVSTVSLTTNGRRRLLHTIRTDPSFGFRDENVTHRRTLILASRTGLSLYFVSQDSEDDYPWLQGSK